MTNTETDKELMARVDEWAGAPDDTLQDIQIANAARLIYDLQAALAASQQECKRLRGVGKHIDTLICQIDPAVADTWPRSRLEALKDIQRLFKKALAQQQGGEGKDGTGIR